MAKKRELNERARGKHIGHACEGHLRGLLAHLPGVDLPMVTRELPFSSPVDPDAVLLSRTGKVRAVFVVAYWEEAGSSHKKMHRTRTEYFEILRIREDGPQHFEHDFQIVTVLYGTDGGWKDLVLSDLGEQCPPLIFLPSVRSCRWKTIVDWSFGEYVARWESGHSDAREYVETVMAKSEPDGNDKALLTALRAALSSGAQPQHSLGERSVATRVPSTPVRTRYRQPLGILSLFEPAELEGWLARRNVNDSAAAMQFAVRALFLDMGSLSKTTSIRRNVVFHFHPRRAVEKDGRYAPHRPDFKLWQSLEVSELQSILEAHRSRTENPTSVFRGGAFDQCAGNFRDITTALVDELPVVIRAIKANNGNRFKDAMQHATLTGPDQWHPARGHAHMCPAWSFTVCALAIVVNSRGLRSRFNARRQVSPSSVESAALLSELQPVAAQVVEVLEEVLLFLEHLRNADMATLIHQDRPRLLDLDEPCSWLADLYNTLTTNSSHNPLNEVLWRYLNHRFPEGNWHGWPQRRSISASAGLGDAGGRRQWGFVGMVRDMVVCAEVKSVTANNWGNKSKELYDRVGELNRAARTANTKVLSIMLFDGDLAADALAELRTGIAHDEILTVDEVIAELSAASDSDGEV